MKLPPRWSKRRSMLAVAALVAAALVYAGLRWQATREIDRVLFTDVTQQTGLAAYQGMTHGAAWGDVDGDGLPDLYVSNHLNNALLFRNTGGRLEDVTAKWLDPADIGGDKHGAAWADFDNTGRRGLVQLTGAVSGMGAEAKRLFRNEAGHLSDVATATGVVNAEHRARTPLWLDLDNDGRLDLFQGAEGRLDHKPTPFVFINTGTGFRVDGQALPLRSPSAPFCTLTRLAVAPQLHLVCRLESRDAAVQVLDLGSLPAKTLDALPQTAFEDIATADFDHSGRLALFLARRYPPGAVALARPADQHLIASVAVTKERAEQPAGFSFRAKGPLRVVIKPTYPGDGIAPAQIHLGAQGSHPQALSFEVDGAVGALPAPVPAAQPAVFIGHTVPDRWEVRVAIPASAFASGPRSRELQVGITAPGMLDDVKVVGETRAEEAPSRLFVQRDGKLVDESEQRGVNRRVVAGASVVAGDFDNDTHVDLFVLASGEIGKQENLLLLNDGSGHFRVVKDAGGAAGPRTGVGDCVSTVDYDGDGFLDLFVANGASMGRSLGLPSDAGGYTLYRNVGKNGNHWLEIDLEGTRSNRDGIGAIVRVAAAGVKQMRLQDGGQHNRCQNHSRLHFGLAKAVQIDTITVHWPSGTVQELRGVKADQVLKIKEAAAP